MHQQPARYRTSLEDSARWDGFGFRPGDIVISAPSKSGTTWTQMICALLVFQTPDLPAPLTTLSPWVDIRVRPVPELFARLEDQRHRRFIKTHTPLDGLPYDERVTYLAVGRDPRDVAMSLRHQGANLRREVVRRLVATTDGEPAPPASADVGDAGPGHDPGHDPGRDWRGRPADVHAFFRGWVDDDTSPHDDLDSLRGMVWQQSRAWERRTDDRVLLVHYADLAQDLEGQMRRIADRLGITVAEATWPHLIGAATFARMRERSADLVPDERLGIMKSTSAFFRHGSAGGWREVLDDTDLASYERRLTALNPPADLVGWLHHGSR